MSENSLDIPRTYADDSAFTSDILDAILDEIESWATIIDNNQKQMLLDTFRLGQALDGDGAANLSKSLQDQHEFPLTMVYFDDFMEAVAALAATTISSVHWTGGGTNGTQAIVAGVGGWMELDTTATGSRTSTLTFTTANFDIAYAPRLEF